MNRGKTILFCPLNWGLGHATRDIPIIDALIKAGHEVIIATESPLLELFKKSFPNIQYEYFPGPKIKYSKGNYLLIKLLTQMPEWLIWLHKEKKSIKKLVKKHKPSIIISDNRYCARIKGIKSIIITHQLMLKMPPVLEWMEKPLHHLIKSLILRFDECWIPDLPYPDSLSGDLTNKYALPSNARHIGPISRFMNPNNQNLNIETTSVPDLLIILSGPEPQKSILKTKLLNHFSVSELSIILVTGEPDKKEQLEPIKKNSISIYPHLSNQKMQFLIQNTPVIITRSGYSTIMDLWFLNKSAIIIPTPGQTEQEYLAQYHSKKHYHISQDNTSKLNIKFLEPKKGLLKNTKHSNMLHKAIFKI